MLKRRKQLPPDWQLTQYLWLATGGKSQFNNRLTVLKGRKIIAFPSHTSTSKSATSLKSTPPLPIEQLTSTSLTG